MNGRAGSARSSGLCRPNARHAGLLGRGELTRAAQRVLRVLPLSMPFDHEQLVGSITREDGALESVCV